MTVKEFLKALEDIKRTHGYNRFDLYARDGDNYLQFFIGKFKKGLRDIMPSRDIVWIRTTDFDRELKEIYDTVEKFKKALAQNKVSDNAVIKLYIDGVWEPDGYEYDENFNIIEVVPGEQKKYCYIRCS